MNIKKFEKRLDRVQKLFSAIKEEGNISKIERDLLANYVRKLYETLFDEVEAVAKKKIERDTYQVEKTIDVKSEKINDHTTQEFVLEKEEKEPENQSIPEIEEVNSVIEEVKEQKEITIPEEYQELFNIEEGGEISDKLSMTSIKELKKAFSINERIFTIQELFGGNTQKFNDILGELDSLKTYESATDYIFNNIAQQEEWASNSRLKKAKKFMNLVYRRFN